LEPTYSLTSDNALLTLASNVYSTVNPGSASIVLL